MSKQAVVEYVEKNKPEIDQLIAKELEKRKEEVGELSEHLVPIVEAMEELSKGGKRLRAMLTLLGYELAGNKLSEEILKAGAAMEIFHLGLLIQDDMMDRDVLRRGVKTINARYEDAHTGNFVAMLAGDYVFPWVMEMLMELDLSAERKQAGLMVWVKYFRRVGYGQTLDGLAIADDETIMQILQLKSGEYTCVLPLLLGAKLGGGKRELLVGLEKYAMELGWTFQLRDDWLSVWGEESKTGKPVGNDEREGKKTFATLYGKEKLEAEIERHMREGKRWSQGNQVLDGLLEWMATREN